MYSVESDRDAFDVLIFDAGSEMGQFQYVVKNTLKEDL